MSKYWFLSNSSSRDLYCSFDNPAKLFSPNSQNTSAHSMSEDDKVKELPQKMFYLEMLLRRGRMRSFCNTTCKISLTVWKMNSKNPQLEKKRFAKTWFPSDFSFKTAGMQFWHTCQKVYNEGLNCFAKHQQFIGKSIKKLVWVKLRIMMTHSFQFRQLFLKLFTKRPKIFRSLSDVDRKEVKSQKIVSATGSSWIVDFYFE